MFQQFCLHASFQIVFSLNHFPRLVCNHSATTFDTPLIQDDHCLPCTLVTFAKRCPSFDQGSYIVLQHLYVQLYSEIGKQFYGNNCEEFSALSKWQIPPTSSTEPARADFLSLKGTIPCVWKITIVRNYAISHVISHKVWFAWEFFEAEDWVKTSGKADQVWYNWYLPWAIGHGFLFL